MKVILFVIMFLVIGALLILSNHHLPLYKDENFAIFQGLYLDWLGGVYEKTISITGEVISTDWLPG